MPRHHASGRSAAARAIGRRAQHMLAALGVAESAYLLIAQPQSSSTAALHSLSNFLKARRKQDFFCECDTSNEALHCPVERHGRYRFGHRFFAFNEHTDVCDTKPDMLLHWAFSPWQVFKQHLPPTRQHMKEARFRGAIFLTRTWHL